jgi:hypothetical protein
MDWINQMNVLKEKIKFQLNARKVYTLASLDKYFKVWHYIRKQTPTKMGK